MPHGVSAKKKALSANKIVDILKTIFLFLSAECAKTLENAHFVDDFPISVSKI